MRLTFLERAAQGFGVGLAVLIIPVVIGIQIIPTLWPPNGLSQAQSAFCNRDRVGVFGGPDFVADVAWTYVRQLPDYAAPWGFRDPQWAAACRYSYVLDGVSGEQSV